MPDSPVDYALASEVRSGGGERGFNTAFEQIFYSFFFGLLIIHERIQRYIIACHITAH